MELSHAEGPPGPGGSRLRWEQRDELATDSLVSVVSSLHPPWSLRWSVHC